MQVPQVIDVDVVLHQKLPVAGGLILHLGHFAQGAGEEPVQPLVEAGHGARE
jgi:hypothetical protein